MSLTIYACTNCHTSFALKFNNKAFKNNKTVSLNKIGHLLQKLDDFHNYT